MSTDAYQEIMTAFDQGALDQLEKELGVEGQRTREATGAAVGTILEGLRRKAQQQQQAEAQPQAGKGSAVEDLLKKWGMGDQAEAPEAQAAPKADPKQLDDIFGDIFGKQGKQDVERRFGKAVKVDPSAVKKIFGAVLPIVLGALAKARQAAPEKSGEQGGGFSLDDILGKAKKDFDQQAEGKKKGGGGLLEIFLDKDQDGDVDLGDLAGIFLNRK